MERNKSIKDIGKLSGKLLVFGGPYSNLQALQKLRNIAHELAIPSENIICTGDVVGYCAQPEESVQLMRDWGVHSIAGNVEIQLREGQEDCGCDFKSGTRCDVFSRQWYPYAKKILSEVAMNWMKDLPDFIQLEYAGKKITVVHGSFFETSGYVFQSTPWEIKEQQFKATQSEVILAGHCGLPFHQIVGNKYWLNPGVIGMPANDGTSRVWYMLLDQADSGAFNFTHHSFDYDHSTAAKTMSEKKLPIEYAQTLGSGLWDNMEILPDEEKKLQGVKLAF